MDKGVRKGGSKIKGERENREMMSEYVYATSVYSERG